MPWGRSVWRDQGEHSEADDIYFNQAYLDRLDLSDGAGLTTHSRLTKLHQQTVAGEDVQGVFAGVWAEDRMESSAREATLAKINNR